MKFLYLLFVCIVFASCSVLKVDDQSKAELKLPVDIIRLIATYLKPDEIVKWRHADCSTLRSLSLKKLVQQFFDISELESINDNEPELAWVMMRLANISNDPFRFFKALMKDVVEGKKSYEVLFGPLILHLLQSFLGLRLQEKLVYQQYCNEIFKESFKRYMIKACILKNHFDLVLIIVRNNADLSGWALRYAAQRGHASLIELLLDNRVNISPNNVGDALICAAQERQATIVKLLLDNCSDISADDAGWALTHSARNGDTQIVQILLQSCTNISADDCGWALKHSALGGYIDIVELLLRSRTGISADDFGWALTHSARNGDTQIVQILLQSCTNISADDFGWALKHSALRGYIDIVEFLLRSRTGISADDFSWALQYASQNEHTSVVKLITDYHNDISEHYNRPIR